MIPTQRGGRGYEEDDDEVVSVGAGGKCCSDREESVLNTQSVLDWVCLCHMHERCLKGVDITFVQSAETKQEHNRSSVGVRLFHQCVKMFPS